MTSEMEINNSPWYYCIVNVLLSNIYTDFACVLCINVFW